MALNLNKLLKIDLNGNSDQDPEDEQEDKNMTERVHKDNMRQTGNTTNTVNQSQITKFLSNNAGEQRKARSSSRNRSCNLN